MKNLIIIVSISITVVNILIIIHCIKHLQLIKTQTA